MKIPALWPNLSKLYFIISLFIIILCNLNILSIATTVQYTVCIHLYILYIHIYMYIFIYIPRFFPFNTIVKKNGQPGTTTGDICKTRKDLLEHFYIRSPLTVFFFFLPLHESRIHRSLISGTNRQTVSSH